MVTPCQALDVFVVCLESDVWLGCLGHHGMPLLTTKSNRVYPHPHLIVPPPSDGDWTAMPCNWLRNSSLGSQCLHRGSQTWWVSQDITLSSDIKPCTLPFHNVFSYYFLSVLGTEPRTLYVLGKYFATVPYHTHTHCLCIIWIYYYHPHSCEDRSARVKDLTCVEPQMGAVVISDDSTVSVLIRTF